MKKLYIITLASLLMAACAEDVETTQNDARYITFNVTDQNYLPQPVEETRSAQASPFDGEAQEFTPSNSLFNTPTEAPATTPQPAIDVTPIETDLDEDLCLITTVEDGIHLDNAAATTRGAQVTTGSSFNFGVSEFKNSDGSAISNMQNLSLSTTAQPSTSQKVNTGKTWESDAAQSSPKYDFCAYSPYLSAAANGLTLNSGNKTITYNCDGVEVANQPDLMTACASAQQYAKDGVNLDFGHRLCAVKIELGTATTGCTINSVSFSSIIKSGTVSLTDGSWSNKGTAGAYNVSGITQATQSSSEAQNVAVYLMMVPQTLSSCVLTITITDANSLQHTLKATLTDKTWDPGKTVTLTITPAAITSMTVNYPTAWGTLNRLDWQQYASGDSFGLFAVDKDGKIVIANESVTASAAGSSVNLTTTANRFYSQQYTYYIYYPYQSDLTDSGKSGYAIRQGQTTSATDADTFFGDVKSGWTVNTDQSTQANFKASDLQIAKATVSSNTLSANLTHKMGLVGVTLSAHNVYDNIVYNGNTYNSSTKKWTVSSYGTYSVWNGSTTFTSTDKPLVSGTSCYQVVKPASTTLSFTASTDETNKKYAWTKACTAIATANTYESYTVDYDVDFIAATWLFSYSGTCQQWEVPKAGKYKLQVWGAAGGGWGNHAATPGGYSYGNKTLEKGSALFVCAGGSGSGAGVGTLNSYNGGGKNSYGGGGGATHMATRTGVLSSLSSYKSSVIIVAGGGGSNGGQSAGLSGTTTCHGGFGGGTTGGWEEGSTLISYYDTNSNRVNGDVGATQSRTGSAGVQGSFGQGAAGDGKGGCGGGGYYGGSGSGGNILGERCGGGGGSGYVGGCESPANTQQGTIWGTTTFENINGGTEKGHIGDGYGKISFIPQ